MRRCAYRRMPNPIATENLTEDNWQGCSAANNPFRINRIHALEYTDSTLDWEALFLRLKKTGNRGAIVGPHGYGKSTLMCELGVRLTAAGFPIHAMQLTEDAPRITSKMWQVLDALTSETWLLLDGAEQLGFWAWRKFYHGTRRFQGMIITLHTPGRLPVLYTCRTSPALLDLLLTRLCPVVSRQLHETAHTLYNEKNGDLRAVFLELYDRVADGRLRIVPTDRH